MERYTPEAGIDFAEPDLIENERTKIAPNPVVRSTIPPAPITPASPGSSARRIVSSFGAPRANIAIAGDRQSLYERLLESGALDEVMALAAENAACEPLLEVSRMPSAPLNNDDRAPGELADELEPASATSARDSAEPLSLGDLDPFDLDGRDSVEPLRDSDLEFTSADEEELARVPTRKAAIGLLPRPITGRPPPAPRALPSVMLSAQISTRYDATERISTMPKTHPLANSLAPVAPESEPPTSVPLTQRRGAAFWQGGFALAVLAGFGIAAARYHELYRPYFEPGYTAEAKQVERSAATVQPARPAVVISTSIPAEPPAVSPLPALLPPRPISEPPAITVPAPTPAERRDAARLSRSLVPATAPMVDPVRAGEGRDGAIETPRPASPSASPQVTEPVAPLTARPSREQVVAAMDAIYPRLKECVADKSGFATVTLTVRSAGFVSYALVDGTFQGTAEGACIARVVKEAEFPPFSDPMLRVAYPFQF